jgi:hypothetical protein
VQKLLSINPTKTPTNNLIRRTSDEQLLDIQRQELFESLPSDSSTNERQSIDLYDEQIADRLFIFPIKHQKFIFNLTIHDGAKELRGNLRRALLNLKLVETNNSTKRSSDATIHALKSLVDLEGKLLGRVRSVPRSTAIESESIELHQSAHNWHKYDITSLLDSTQNFEAFHSNRFLAHSNQLLHISTRKSNIVSAFITLEYENIEVRVHFALVRRILSINAWYIPFECRSAEPSAASTVPRLATRALVVENSST